MRYTAETRVLALDAAHPDPAVIEQAAAVLRAGGLVAFPTETVYGLGADALDSAAVERIYSAKGRPANNPLIVHIAAVEQVAQVAVEIPALAHDLMAHFWPGPLTLVLKRHPRITQAVSLGRATVAVRLPSHPVARALIAAAEVPVAAPSANQFTRPSGTTAQHVLSDLGGHVDLILDGGATPIGVESTVLDLSGGTPLVLRPGGVTLEALRDYLPGLQRAAEVVAMDDAHARPASPGMMSRHYSPQADLLLFDGPHETVIEQMHQTAQAHLDAGERVGLLLPDDELARFSDLEFASTPLGHDPAEIARRLFAALRDLDAQGVEVILARLMEPVGLGVTISDRLRRAADGRVIEVHEEDGLHTENGRKSP